MIQAYDNIKSNNGIMSIQLISTTKSRKSYDQINVIFKSLPLYCVPIIGLSGYATNIFLIIEVTIYELRANNGIMMIQFSTSKFKSHMFT
jgi:hypothetical protein